MEAELPASAQAPLGSEAPKQTPEAPRLSMASAQAQLGSEAPKQTPEHPRRAMPDPLWEVFVRAKRGLAHNHVGSLHAADAEMALRNARDVFTRRMEGVSIWVVPSAAITATSPEERDSFFDPAADKAYRHPTFYDIPKEVKQL